jgi:methylisocitrate lyase
VRSVIDYIDAGAAGLHLEDQRFPKKCGHLDGKTLVPTDDFCAVIDMCRAARDRRDASFVLCARTDARGVESLDAVVDRCVAYVGAGADMVFPEGLLSADEFRDVAARVRARCAGVAARRDAASHCQSRSPRRYPGPYMLANMTEFGKTPPIPLADFDAMGYDVVIFPVSSLRAAMGAVVRMLAELRATGVAPTDGMQTRAELYHMLRYDPSDVWCYPGVSPPTSDAE